MNIAVRAVEASIGACTLLFTISWGIIEMQNFDTLYLLIDEMVPVPLMLPLFAGLLTILNLEVFVATMLRGEPEEEVVTKTEKQIGQAIASQATKLSNWNSRLDDKERK